MEVNSLYMEFLKANYPTVAGRLDALKDTSPSGTTPEEIAKSKAKLEEEFNTLANDAERVNRFQIWEKVPTILRDRYYGRVPQEVMEAAEREEIYVLREMEYHPEKRNVDEVRAEVEEKYGSIIMPKDIVNFAAKSAFAAAIVAGYSEICSAELARQRQDRDALFDKLDDPNLSKEEKDKIHRDILKSQQATADAIRADWGGGYIRSKDENGADIIVRMKPHQPEKHLIHLLGKFNAGKIDKDELVADMSRLDLQEALKERQPELLAYLQRRNIQAKIGHFNDETRDFLAKYVLKYLPDNERSEIMENAQRRYSKIRENLNDEQRAIAVAKNMNANKANILPRHNNLSAKEKLNNMPSALNRGGYERQA